MRRLLVIGLLLAAAAPRSHAQFVARPEQDWRTTETAHFSVHYPVQYREWSRAVAGRLDSARTLVGAIVGFVPERRVQVLIDDPVNAPNGFALPALDRPTMVFFPVPPTPRQAIGNSRDWGEMLAVHEFAHLAHLTRPSRAPFDAWRLLPFPIGPIARRVPRWVTEGFATYVEGRVTGSGRPHNAQRAAVLRQWALEGRLPTYAQMSGWNAYNGGAFAYLMGSAYLEWLAAREGDSTITHLWRRLTARTSRSFPEAFAGVYGRGPEALYGRFTTELTGDALAVERAIDSLGGVVEGDLVQRLAWETGDPALSPDGRRVALVLRSATRPGRVVVWNTGPDSMAAHAAAARDSARARAQRLDPQDVPDREFFPPPKRPMHVLEARDGRAFDAPRFMPDGRSVLLTHAEPIGDGAFRPDLYRWDLERDDVARLTHGAAVRQPDPARDGRTAVAVQCLRGWCDLVRVDLASGEIALLRAGSPSLSYYRPRVSPDGARIVVSVQEHDRWRLLLVDARDPARAEDVLAGAEGNRFDATWVDAGSLVAVSDASGIANLERIDLATRSAEPVTRVTGGAFAPAVQHRTGDVWYLALHARGLDLRRLAAPATGVVLPAQDSTRFPAMPARPAVTPPMIPIAALAAERPYGLGPRMTRWLPAVTTDASGVTGSLLLIDGDPAGRLELALVGAVGSPTGWQGGRAWASLHRWRPSITIEGVGATQQSAPVSGQPTPWIDADLMGGGARAAVRAQGSAWRADAALGGSSMWITGDGGAPSGGARHAAWTSVEAATWRRVLGTDLAAAARVGGDAGRHAAAEVAHLQVSVGVSADLPVLPPIRGSLLHARDAGSPAAPLLERIVVGGAPSPVVDATLLPQRIAMPALPAGALAGSRATIGRVEAGAGPLTPFVWAAQVDGDAYGGWQRVAGLEGRLRTDRLPIVPLPRAEVTGGAAYSIDRPHKGRAGAWLTMTFRP